MSEQRFAADRGRHGSVCVYDTQRGRIAASFPRDWAHYGYHASAADIAAETMAQICADALNVWLAAHTAKQEGGKH